MNITVDKAEGLPDKAYLSIRIGEVRRQAQYREGEKFHFPLSQHMTMKVDVFQPLGSAVVPCGMLKQDPMHSEEVVIHHRSGSKQISGEGSGN